MSIYLFFEIFFEFWEKLGRLERFVEKPGAKSYKRAVDERDDERSPADAFKRAEKTERHYNRDNERAYIETGLKQRFFYIVPFRNAFDEIVVHLRRKIREKIQRDRERGDKFAYNEKQNAKPRIHTAGGGYGRIEYRNFAP